MTGRLSQIWRYPVKSIGRQKLDSARLEAGRTLPWDRHWAVMHDSATQRLTEGDQLAGWLPKAAFLRGAAGPELQAISGGLTNGKLCLQHPTAGEIELDPTKDEDHASLLDWLRPLWPAEKPEPALLVTGPVPLTDSRAPFISILSLDSLRAVESHVGQRLGVERWRGNLWVEGFKPFAEREWIGKCLRIGEATVILREGIGRCAATSVDTDTGEPDHDMIRVLTEGFGDACFGVYAEVLTGAEIAPLDEIIVVELDETQPRSESLTA